MKQVKRVLLFGDYARAPYHPLDAVQDEIQAILGIGFRVDVTDDYDQLSETKLTSYDLCISYADRWEDALSHEQVAGLIAFVARGGGLLVLHNGISLQNRHELRQLIGARFMGHPEYQSLSFQFVAPAHAILNGAETFEMDEEPYLFEFDPFVEKELLMTYTMDEKTYPAAWAHQYGLGRVVYFMPGHHIKSFQVAAYRSLILSGASWAADAIINV